MADTYEELLAEVLKTGTHKTDRTGTGTTSIFGPQLRFNLAEGFPLITTKRVHFKSIAIELLWMLRGDTNVKWMNDQGVTIWDEWCNSNGDLGPVYGKQWRNWMGIDQIKEVVTSIKENPDSRRHIVSAWNVSELKEMALPPCHAFFQFYVADGKLSCQLYQRSADMFLGVPFNIASYSLLVHMVAQQTNLIPGEFIWTAGDCHIYDNHLEQVKEQIQREPFIFPTLKINRKPESIFNYEYSDFELLNYKPHASIKGQVAV